MLKNGRVDMVLESGFGGASIIKKSFGPKEFRVLEPPFSSHSNHLIISKDEKDKKLLLKFNQTLLKMKNNGIIKKIYLKHINQ